MLHLDLTMGIRYLHHKMNTAKDFDKVVWSTCNVNCGNRCPVRLFVNEGKVVRIETDNTGDEPFGTHEIRACLRGRGLRRWVYSKERLLALIANISSLLKSLTF